MFDVPGAARRLRLTGRTVAQLCREYQFHERLHRASERERERLARWEIWRYRVDETRPRYGCTPEQIAVEAARLAPQPIERHECGACVVCVNYYSRQTTRLDLHRCEHLSVTFSFDVRGKARRESHNLKKYLAEIRAAAPPTGPALPAWPFYVRQGRRATAYNEDRTLSYAASAALKLLKKHIPKNDYRANQGYRDYCAILIGTSGAAGFQAHTKLL
jgi:hypothetical protein